MQLLSIASNLGRVASCLRRPPQPAHGRTVSTFLEQSMEFVRWALDSAPTDTWGVLVHLQRKLQVWLTVWRDADEGDSEQRSKLADELETWHNQLLQIRAQSETQELPFRIEARIVDGQPILTASSDGPIVVRDNRIWLENGSQIVIDLASEQPHTLVSRAGGVTSSSRATTSNMDSSSD